MKVVYVYYYSIIETFLIFRWHWQNVFMRSNILFKDISFLPPYSPSVKIRTVYYVGL